MEIIIHRVNTLKHLKSISQQYGAEIDIRAHGSELILNHEAFQKGERFENYLDEYRHGTLVLNIKETGIESDVLRLVRMRPQIKSYFLLDVEFPYIYRASRNGESAIAIRFSEDESIETVNNYTGKVDWVWIDTNTRLPVDENNISTLNQFKKCLVCPELWGRSKDIELFKLNLKKINFSVDSVITNEKFRMNWSL